MNKQNSYPIGRSAPDLTPVAATFLNVGFGDLRPFFWPKAQLKDLYLNIYIVILSYNAMDTLRLREKNSILSDIRNVLKNRRFVFFSTKHWNPEIQQTIIDAEKILEYIKYKDLHAFFSLLPKYADDFIRPLIPAKKSPLHDRIQQLYDKLKTFNYEN